MAGTGEPSFEQLARHLDPSWVNGKWQPKSMTLDTIKNSNDNKDRFLKVTNLISDIPGAQPKQMKNFNKPQLHSTSDIAGAHPRQLHKQLNKRSFYNVADIDGAKPATRTFHSKRCVDPLSPKYQLPSFDVPDPPVPRFLRDSVDVSDVDGTKPKQHNERKTRDIMRVSDIDGAHPARWLRPPFQAIPERYDPVSLSNNIEDINQLSGKAKQGTNPLRPIYHMNDMRIEDEEYTYPRKAKTKLNPNYVLRTDDIQGATPGVSVDCFPHMTSRRHYRKVNDVSDVEGAKADTLFRGLRSLRCTDPLNPRYQYLDGQFTSRPRTVSHGSRANKDGSTTLRSSASAASVTSGRRTRRSNSQRSQTSHGSRSQRGSVRGEALHRLSSRSASSTPQLIQRSNSQSKIPLAKRDNLACGGSGLVPTGGDFSAPHGRGIVNSTESSIDHFKSGMLLDAQVERMQLAGLHDHLELKQDHLGSGMVPQDEPVELPHKKVEVEKRRDSIGSWANWCGSGDSNRAPSAAAAAQATARSLNPCSAREMMLSGRHETGPETAESGRQQSGRFGDAATSARPATSVGSSRSKTLQRSLSSRSGPSTQRSLTNRSGSRSVRSQGQQRFHLNLPKSSSRTCGSRPSTAITGNTSSKLLASKASQLELDQRSVAELPDTLNA